jgi:hypothetical protein
MTYTVWWESERGPSRKPKELGSQCVGAYHFFDLHFLPFPDQFVSVIQVLT